MMNKRGEIFDIILFIVLAFVTVMVLGMFLYGFNTMSSHLTGITSQLPGNKTIGSVAQDTIGNVNNGLDTLKIVAFAIIFGMILTIILGNFLIDVHPAFFVAYLMIAVGAVIVSVPVANTYEELTTSATFGATLSGFTATNYIILNLPVWVTIIGFIGAIFMFIGIVRDREAGGIV